MTRIQLACYTLIASAVVLAGLLIMQLGRHSTGSEAQAAMVIARDNFAMLTTQTRSGEEALFVLDNQTGRLLIYRLDVQKKNLRLVANEDLPRIFSRLRIPDDNERGR